MQKKPCILIVDDTELNIDILMGILKHYDVRPALTGQDALKIALNEKIDLIILDIVMPEMDGFEVCKRLKDDDRTKNIPVMMVSVNNMEQDMIRGYKLGIIDYIIKPYNPVELLEKVKVHLDLYACHLNINTQKLSVLSAQAMTKDMLLHLHNYWNYFSRQQDDLPEINFSETLNSFVHLYDNDTQAQVFTIRNAISFAEKIIIASFIQDNIQLQIIENQPARASGNINEYAMVIVNLLSNVRETLLKRKVKAPKIAIEISIQDGKSFIILRDNSGDSSQEDIQNMFTPSLRMISYDNIKLYLAKSIVENMGGQIDCQQWQLGVEFSIIL
jgi:DNA-binding response OmpR family regulator